jgi:hypothetical protein
MLMTRAPPKCGVWGSHPTHPALRTALVPDKNLKGVITIVEKQTQNLHEEFNSQLQVT